MIVTPGADAVHDVVRRWAERPDRADIFDVNSTLSDDEPLLLRIFSELFSEHPLTHH